MAVSFEQNAAKSLKEGLDKKYGAAWYAHTIVAIEVFFVCDVRLLRRHVVIGEGFGFEITHEVKHILYMFFGGNIAVVIWKCS